MNLRVLWKNKPVRGYALELGVSLVLGGLLLALSISLLGQKPDTLVFIVLGVASVSCFQTVLECRGLLRAKVVAEKQEYIRFDGGEMSLSLPADCRSLMMFFDVPLSHKHWHHYGTIRISKTDAGAAHSVRVPQGRYKPKGAPVVWRLPTDWTTQPGEFCIKVELQQKGTFFRQGAGLLTVLANAA